MIFNCFKDDTTILVFVSLKCMRNMNYFLCWRINRAIFLDRKEIKPEHFAHASTAILFARDRHHSRLAFRWNQLPDDRG
jgi:hypothetical protein